MCYLDAPDVKKVSIKNQWHLRISKPPLSMSLKSLDYPGTPRSNHIFTNNGDHEE